MPKLLDMPLQPVLIKEAITWINCTILQRFWRQAARQPHHGPDRWLHVNKCKLTAPPWLTRWLASSLKPPCPSLPRRRADIPSQTHPSPHCPPLEAFNCHHSMSICDICSKVAISEHSSDFCHHNFVGICIPHSIQKWWPGAQNATVD